MNCSFSYRSKPPILLAVEKYFRAGFNPIPLRCDGSKSPVHAHWTRWSIQRRLWIDVELDFSDGEYGIGLVCGKGSAGLAVLDFDHDASTVFPKWYRLVVPHFPQLSSLPVVMTPKDGFHVYCRTDVAESGRKLAQLKSGDRLATIIEIRGHGNQVVAVGSPLSVHPLNKPYRIIRNDPCQTPRITMDQWNIMLQAAMSFNRYEAPIRSRVSVGTVHHRRADDEERPGDWFNRVAEWEQILTPHGWTISRTRGNTVYWRKPDSSGNGHQATTGDGGRDTLHCFSSSAYPFDQDREYKKFGAYTLLNHAGDWGSAARAIRNKMESEGK